MSTIKLKIDVIHGTMDVECSGDDFQSVMSRAEKVLENFGNATRPPLTEKKAEVSETPRRTEKSDNPSAKQTSASPKAKRKKGGARAANWKIVGDLMSEDQRNQLKDFYKEKAPGKQNDQVAVLAHKLGEMLNREGFDGNEIHTAFQVVDQKTPANLSGVFGNMAAEGLGKMVDKKWTPNFKSDDLVKHDLPAVSKD